MIGYISTKEEWLYPDTPLKEVGSHVKVHTAKNGCEGVKILFETDGDFVDVVADENPDFDVKIYEMIDVYVGYNEVENCIQDGQFVNMDPESVKPDFCTRKAPFRVYEPLHPTKGQVNATYNRAPIYLSIQPKVGTLAGKHEIRVTINQGGLLLETIYIQMHVYDVMIPDETLSISNWFSLENMSANHGHLPLDSEAYYEMVRKYARIMRRLRQTHFFINLHPKMVNLGNGEYDFSYLKSIIKIFFDEGFQTLEFGSLLIKSPTLFTADFKCVFDPDISMSTDEGYYLMSAFIKEIKEFLEENGWQDKTVFHIVDEPDVHMKNDEVLQKRKQDYFKVASMLRKAIPGCKIIEAVKSTAFKSAIDIWVPLTANYEEFHDDYDRMKATGDEVWTYVCCVPTGHHLNRFLDIDLIKSRLIFWGISRYNMTGYLHWGLNQQPSENFDPYENSNTPNEAFDGIFPSGDAFMVYPGKEGPIMGMRFEAQRKGAEDYELLRILKEQDILAYRHMMDGILTGFDQYSDDVDVFDCMRIELYSKLEEIK